MSSSARNNMASRKPRIIKKSASFKHDDNDLPHNYIVKKTPVTNQAKALRQIRRVYVHTTVAKALSVATGGLLVIRPGIKVKGLDPAAEDVGSLGTAIGVAWPTDSLEKTVVQMSAMLRQSHLLNEGDRVRLSKYTGQANSAKMLRICCIDEQEKRPSAVNDPEWANAIKDLLHEIRYITEGMDFECQYSNRTHCFTIISVIPSEGSTSDSKPVVEADNIHKAFLGRLDRLSLNNSDTTLPRYQPDQGCDNDLAVKLGWINDQEDDSESVPDLFLFEGSTLLEIEHRPESSRQEQWRTMCRAAPRDRLEGCATDRTPFDKGMTNEPSTPAVQATTVHELSLPRSTSKVHGLTGKKTPKSKGTPTRSKEESSPRANQKTPVASKFSEVETDEDIESERVSKLPRVLYESIGGLETQVASLREMVELPLLKPHVFARFQMTPPRGVLLYGPPGTGKTMLLRAVASETSARVFTISGPSIISKYMGEAEEKLRKLWKEAERAGPSIIFIDEIDAITPKREADSSEAESRIVASLLTLMDGMDSDSKVVVIGATNRPNSIDSALRRPGRFDREIEIGIPDAKARLSILRIMLQDIPKSLSERFIEDVAGKTHGFVGADLSALCRESVMITIKNGLRDHIPEENYIVEEQHMIEALVHVRPSAMREIFLEPPQVKWADVGGQDHVKQKLQESVEWPLTYPETYKEFGVVPPKGVLLYGPPGCSKTLIAKALATEAGLNFLAVKGPELYNKYVGEAERALREIFRKARAASPSIIFFDEIDALSGSRTGEGEGSSDRILTTLLNELDGVEELRNVTIVAATNRPDVIDSALLRPGRLDRLLYVGPPDLASRHRIFEIQFSHMSIAKDVMIDSLAANTDGCSGAEIVAFCRDAGLLAIQESLARCDDSRVKEISSAHFDTALRKLKRRITPETIEFYEAFAKTYGDSV